MTFHIITYDLDNDGNRGRVLMELNDQEFTEAFEGITIPPRWKIAHLEETEVENHGPRWQVLRNMPLLYDTSTGHNLSKKVAIEMIKYDYQNWKSEHEKTEEYTL